jgi:hypothetical protein
MEAIGETVEAVSEDPAALSEAVVGEDLTALDEAAVVEAWRRRWRSGHAQHGCNTPMLL